MSKQRAGCSVEIGAPAFVITIVFLVLKLTDVIDWSWWWVFAPIWISLGTAFVILIIAAIIMSMREDR